MNFEFKAFLSQSPSSPSSTWSFRIDLQTRSITFWYFGFTARLLFASRFSSQMALAFGAGGFHITTSALFSRVFIFYGRLMRMNTWDSGQNLLCFRSWSLSSRYNLSQRSGMIPEFRLYNLRTNLVYSTVFAVYEKLIFFTLRSMEFLAGPYLQRMLWLCMSSLRSSWSSTLTSFISLSSEAAII